MDALTGVALAAPAGLNAYIPLLTVGLAGRFGIITLGEPFNLLQEWWVIGVVAVLLIIELTADKIPAVDSVNDVIQTVVRPAVGGLLAVSAADAAVVPAPVLFVAGVVTAGGMHAAKAGSRPIINAVTGGMAAPVASAFEDVVSVVLTVLAFLVPLLVVAFVVIVVVVVARAFARGRTGHPGRSRAT